MQYALLTGGHSGIGLALSDILLQQGYHLGWIVRSEQRGRSAQSEVTNGASIDLFVADLSNQEEVKSVAEQVSQKWPSLDLLFNNAGVLLGSLQHSPQGNEMHYEVNTLCPYLLTKSLAPLLQATEGAQVISTATGGLDSQKAIKLHELIKPESVTKLFGAYLTSKLAMTLLMQDLAKELPSVQIKTVDPGPNKTKMTKGEGMPGWLMPLRNLFFAAPTKGGSLLWKATQIKDTSPGAYIRGNKPRVMRLTLTLDQKAKLLDGIKK
ncbi:MAG: SDR family NAD(P)-dependent oxidoreductase [Bacteroidota bacterium]